MSRDDSNDGIFGILHCKIPKMPSFETSLYELLSCELLSCELVSCELLSCELLGCELLSCELLGCELLSCDLLSPLWPCGQPAPPRAAHRRQQVTKLLVTMRAIMSSTLVTCSTVVLAMTAVTKLLPTGWCTRAASRCRSCRLNTVVRAAASMLAQLAPPEAGSSAHSGRAPHPRTTPAPRAGRAGRGSW